MHQKLRAEFKRVAAYSPLSTFCAVILLTKVESLLMGLKASLLIISSCWQQRCHWLMVVQDKLVPLQSAITSDGAPKNIVSALWQQWATAFIWALYSAIWQKKALSGILEIGPSVSSCTQGAQADRPLRVTGGVAHAMQ